MKWEYVGVQELRTGKGMMNYTVKTFLWRTPVPGGWFVVIGAATNSFYYPDPDHIWNPSEMPMPDKHMLLRPASGDLLERDDTHTEFASHGENFLEKE